MNKLRKFEWKTPWYIPLSQVCQISGMLVPVLAALYFIAGGRIPYAGGSPFLLSSGSLRSFY